MHHNMKTAAQVVENQKLVRHHQQNIGRPNRIRQIPVCKMGLDIAHGVVTEVAHQPTVKARQGIQLGHIELTVNALNRR